MFSLTKFDSIYDNTTNKRLDFEDWKEFERTLFSLSKLPTRKPKKGEPSTDIDAVLISPAVYPDSTTRSNSNVECWAEWACLDVDEYDGTMEELLSKLGAYYYVCYSTASSTVEHPKFRLVFPLTRRVERGEIRTFWHAINSEILDFGDAQCKDLSRMYYIPGTYEGAYNFIFVNDGKFIDPTELITKHPYAAPRHTGGSFTDRLPDHIQKMIADQKKSSAYNTSISWTSYKDCEFVNHKLVKEYEQIVGTGWYHHLYKIMSSIASSAIRAGYPITSNEIADMVGQMHLDNRGTPSTRDLVKEADRAIEWAYMNTTR